MVRTKVFVGNLSFRTKEPELAVEFGAAGRVASVNIITRGPRSLGYGFVEMESEEEANKAVTLLNKKPIDGREINVEVAKPREEPTGDRPPRQPREPREPREPGSRPPRQPREPREPREPGSRPPRQPREPRDAGAGGAQNNAGGAPQNNAAPAGDNADRPRRRRIRRRRAPQEGGAPAPTGGAPAPSGGAAPAAGGERPQRQPRQPREPREPRAPRPPRQPTEQAPRNPSKTTLFVANLPFSVDDAGLSDIFKGHAVKTAHVVKKRNGRSKGFGFVEFDNEDAQVKAKNALDKVVVQERELILKIALTENNKDGAAAAAAAADAPKA